MKKTAKIFVAVALLFAGSVFAQVSTTDEYIKPTSFRCVKASSSLTNCWIAQKETKAELLAANYENADIYTNWYDVASNLETRTAELLTTKLNLTFETDIDLGGYLEQKKRCFGDVGGGFYPINYHTNFATVVIDGGNHTIKNYCDITRDVNPAFFRKIKTNVTIKDLAFDSAYVLAKTLDHAVLNAAVVADEVSGDVKAVFENVKVTNSKVYSWNAGTILGTAACNSGSACPEIKFSGVKVENVDLGLNEAYFEDNAQFLSHSYSLWANRVSYRGGLAAHVGGSAEFTNDTASNLRIVEDYSLQIQSSAAYTRFGGFVGGIKPSLNADHNKFSLQNSVVDAEIKGTIVGGLIGYVDPNTLAEKSDLEISNAKVTLNSGDYTGKSDKRNMGGLLGYFQWENGNVSLLKNKVEAKFVCVNPNVGTSGTQMGGLIGQFIAQDNDVAPVNINVEDNNVTAEIDTKEPILYVGGLAGNIVGNVKSDFSIKNDTVSAEIKTTADALYGGGILGYANLSGGGSLIVKNTVVKPVKLNLIAASNEMMKNIEVGLFIGQAMSSYNYGGVVNVSENRARGDIKIAATSLTKTIMSSAGGLLGMVQAGETTVANNVTQGNLDVPKNGGLDGKFFLGYVVGYPVLCGTLTIRNNYHYGSTDVNADLAVGTIHTSSIDIPYTTWKTTGAMDTYDVRYNYRNAVKTLEAEGELALDGSGLIVSGSNKFYDGVISEDAMKSRLFTYVMNATQLDKENPVLWENGTSMPVFSETRTAYRLAISLLNEDYKELTANDKAALKDYLPVEQCEAGACSLYVYTEANSAKEAVLPEDLKYTFDGLETDIVLVDKVSSANLNGTFNFGQVFTKDTTVVGITDHEIDVEYVVEKLGGSDYVPLDEYADYLSYVSPRVDKIRLISGKGVIPVFWLDNDAANGNVPEYELDCDYAYNPCKAGVSLSVCDESSGNFNVRSTASRIGTFEEVLKAFRKRYDGMHQNKLVLKYMPTDLSQGKGTLPRIDVGLFGTNAKINMTAYAYNGKGALKENDSRELGDGIVTQSVNMTSKYQFSLADRGFNVYGWKVDFWVDLEGKPVEEITQCYNEGSETAKCAEAKKYEGLSENYFDKEYKLETVLNTAFYNLNQNKPRLSKWSTKLDPNDTLSLDSMIYAMAVAIPTRAPKAVVLMGVVPDLHAIAYSVNFDVNAGDNNVFLTDRLTDTEIYSRENDETARLPVVLATDACFMGWDKKSDGQAVPFGTRYHTSLDGSLLAAANPNDEESFAVYGNWVPAGSGEGNKVGCNPSSTTIELNLRDKADEEADLGTAVLWQSYQKLGIETEKFVHEFVDGKLEIPTSAEQMTFHVSVKPAETYALVGLSLVEYENGAEKSSRDIAMDFGVDTLVRVTPTSGVEYRLKALFSHYVNLAPDLNGDHGQVFYGASSNMDSILVGEVGQVQFPAWVYTVDACVWSWSLESDSNVDGDDSYHVTTDASTIYDKLQSNKVFYAMWLDADACVERAYNRVSLEAEHGAVQLEEMAQNGSASYMHSFAEDGTMILPQNVGKSEFVLRAKPEQGYKLDSLVMVLRNRDSGDEERFVLKDGEKLPSMTGKFAVSMKGFFSKKKTENNACGVKFAVCSLLNSGNAIRMSYEAKPSNESPVELQVSLMDAQGVPLVESEKLLVESSKSWEYFALVPGKYTVRTVVLGDGDPVTYDTTFVVKPEIEVEKDSWRMLSLSDIDEKSIQWDGDQLFYRWNESAVYADFWKYQKYRGGSVKPEQGYWYNSLEGRSLPLRSDSATRSRKIVWELDSGWTMVANPFGWAIELSEVSDNDSLSFVAWNGNAGYGLTYYLGPYEAAWVLSDKETSIRISKPKAMFVSASVYTPGFDYPNAAKKRTLNSRVLAKVVNRENWTLQAVLSDGRGHSDSWNVLGVGDAAEMLEPPEGMGDHVNLSVVSGKKVLSKSVVAPETGADARGLGGYSWQVALSASSDRVGYLKFEGLADLAGFGYRVFVTYGGETREVPSGDSLRVMLKAAGATATVHVTSNDIRTLASRLENLRFTHVPGALQVGFDVTEGLAGANVTVQLVAVNGKVAASYRAVALAGCNQFTLKAPKPGLYMLRVSLGGQHAVRKVVVSR